MDYLNELFERDLFEQEHATRNARLEAYQTVLEELGDAGEVSHEQYNASEEIERNERRKA